MASFGEPNPPVWPSTVKVYGPGDDATATADVNQAFATNGGHNPANHGQFSDQRYAFLFKPGSYNVDVPVGYYTTVHGLGESPTDVKFTSQKGVHCEEGAYEIDLGALDTFWRGAENFQNNANYPWFAAGGMLWAASQAAGVRRIQQNGDMILFMYRPPNGPADYASGGYLSNSEITGKVTSGSQQQYFYRNNKFSQYGSVWNSVLVGNQNGHTTPDHCGNSNQQPPQATVANTPSIAEKPFISFSADGTYKLNVPQVRTNSQGVDWSTGTQIDFSQVYVASAADNAAAINGKLSAGLHVVLSPGIYKLEAPLQLTHDNQVLLGLGIATLQCQNADAAVTVGNVDGVRVAGILLEAGPKSNVLLRWGDANTKHPGLATNPGFMHDVYARVGGPVVSGVSATTMVEINSGNVIGDNLWLWRADHGPDDSLVTNLNCACDHALVVNGDDVSFYGLAVEHTLKDLVLWNGERGATYFLQSELPYDADPAWQAGQYVGYRVANGVTTHKAVGVGVYHYMRDFPITMNSVIACPDNLVNDFVSPLAVYLNGQGRANHIINNNGDATFKSGSGAVSAWYCGGGGVNNSMEVIV